MAEHVFLKGMNKKGFLNPNGGLLTMHEGCVYVYSFHDDETTTQCTQICLNFHLFEVIHVEI